MKKNWLWKYDDEEDIDSYLSSSDKDDEWTVYRPKSTSAYLRSTYADWIDRSKKHDTRQDMLEVLKEVNKTVNLTQNNIDGDEKVLQVRFSSGREVNNLNQNILYISPNLIRDDRGYGGVLSKADDAYYEALDALNGQAMLCAFMKKKMTTKDTDAFQYCYEWSVKNILMTGLQRLASLEISSLWPGFQSYLEQQRLVFNQTRVQVLSRFSSPDVHIDDFINLLCYNQLSDDKIVYGDVFEPEFASRLVAADKVLAETFGDFKIGFLMKQSSNCFQKIKRILNLENPPPVENEPESESEDEDEGEEDKISISNIDMESKSDNQPFTGDNSFNNRIPVSNVAYEGGDIKPDEELLEKTETLSDKLNKLQDKELVGARYQMIVPAVNSHQRQSYSKLIKERKKSIDTIKNCFQFHNTDCAMRSHGLTSGVIDENNLHRVSMGDYERLYERADTVSRRKWLVSTLIDQSYSMNDNSRLLQARELACMFAEALKSLRDLEFSMYGFSTSDNRIDTIVYKDKNYNKLEALSTAHPIDSTGLGFHIAHVGDKILQQYESYENRILFVITDGEPNRVPTATMNGVQHTRHCVDILRKRGIHVYGIGVADAFDNSVGDSLFGAGQFCVLKDVKSALPVLVNRMRTFLRRMQK